jgi:peptidoglycan/xylan/chitin deacetylase (PgdA/CDA1 family)
MTVIDAHHRLNFPMTGALASRWPGAFFCRPAVLAAVLCSLFGSANARPAVIVTVDVESTESLPLPQQIDPVCDGGVRCGLLQIAYLLEQRRLAGTFFLNVYEYKAWGEPTLRNIARQLHSRGHDVALHTHPQWAYDPQRHYMYDYTLDEQTRIVADGVRLLREWTGLPVVAHRAGAYSANQDSIVALARNGITLDASLFPGERHCRLNELGLPVNFPGQIGGVTEIPVTVYERHERPAGLGHLLPPHVVLGKIDVNAMDDEHQAVAALRSVSAANLPFVVIFLHSFSFENAPGRVGGAPLANERAMRIFQALLDEMSAQQVPVITARDVADQHNVSADDGASGKPSDRMPVPRAEIVVPTLKYAVRVLRSFSTGTRVAIGCTALLSTVAMLWWLRRTGRKGHRSSART